MHLAAHSSITCLLHMYVACLPRWGYASLGLHCYREKVLLRPPTFSTRSALPRTRLSCPRSGGKGRSLLHLLLVAKDARQKRGALLERRSLSRIEQCHVSLYRRFQFSSDKAATHTHRSNCILYSSLHLSGSVPVFQQLRLQATPILAHLQQGSTPMTFIARMLL